jgi:hypothetical protein
VTGTEAGAGLALALLHLAMAVTAAEALLLAWWHRRTGRGLAPWLLWPNLVSGLALMAALRAAMTGAGWPWVALGLAVSGLAHALDLRRRWQTGR